ncbi:MAG: pyrophosphatase PpaX [Candidatus Izemoplasmataceae bacterium]
MNNINTILFDLDGTLIDTNEIIIRSYLYAFKKHLPEIDISRDRVIDHIGPPLDRIFSTYTSSPFKVKAMIETYREFYANNEFAHFKLYEGVTETLNTLHSQGYTLGIVTSKFLESARPSIEFFGLDRWMDAIITLDDVKHPKPDKEPVERALEALDNVDTALMVGDNTSDIESAKSAGILSAGVAWSIKGETVLKAANPDYMLETMDSIYAILDIDKEE